MELKFIRRGSPVGGLGGVEGDGFPAGSLMKTSIYSNRTNQYRGPDAVARSGSFRKFGISNEGAVTIERGQRRLGERSVPWLVTQIRHPYERILANFFRETTGLKQVAASFSGCGRERGG